MIKLFVINGHEDNQKAAEMLAAAGEEVQAYGVPASVILQANNIASPAIIYPGQRLVIPRYTQAPVGTAAAPANRPASPPTGTAPSGHRSARSCSRACARA